MAPSQSPAAFVLRIVSGTTVKATFAVAAGDTIVGRDPKAAVTIDHPSVSRRHFQISVREDGVSVIDLGSSHGLFVNRARVPEARIRIGDEIRAGDVVLQIEAAPPEPIEVYGDVEPTLEAAESIPKGGTLFAQLTSVIREAPAGSRLYALVDGAQAFETAFGARLMGHRLYTLFTGDLAPAAAQVGPILVAIDEPTRFLKVWAERVGQNAGVLLQSPADLTELYAHLRGIFVATDEEKNEYFFRFYDPRVLRAFLPTCRPEELKEFFGPIKRMIAESEDGSSLTTFAVQFGRVVSRDIVPTVSAE